MEGEPVQLDNQPAVHHQIDLSDSSDDDTVGHIQTSCPQLDASQCLQRAAGPTTGPPQPKATPSPSRPSQMRKHLFPRRTAVQGGVCDHQRGPLIAAAQQVGHATLHRNDRESGRRKSRTPPNLMNTLATNRRNLTALGSQHVNLPQSAEQRQAVVGSGVLTGDETAVDAGHQHTSVGVGDGDNAVGVEPEAARLHKPLKVPALISSQVQISPAHGAPGRADTGEQDVVVHGTIVGRVREAAPGRSAPVDNSPQPLAPPYGWILATSAGHVLPSVSVRMTLEPEGAAPRHTIRRIPTLAPPPRPPGAANVIVTDIQDGGAGRGRPGGRQSWFRWVVG